MDFITDNQFFTILLVILAAIVLWIVLRFALKFTFRIFRLGCLAIFIITGLFIAFNWII